VGRRNCLRTVGLPVPPIDGGDGQFIPTIALRFWEDAKNHSRGRHKTLAESAVIGKLKGCTGRSKMARPLAQTNRGSASASSPRCSPCKASPCREPFLVGCGFP
jgi:hypothetical protein